MKMDVYEIEYLKTRALAAKILSQQGIAIKNFQSWGIQDWRFYSDGPCTIEILVHEKVIRILDLDEE
jgi:hypothetical protein